MQYLRFCSRYCAFLGGSYAADSSGIPKYSALILSTLSEQSQKLSWQIKGFNTNGQANQNYSDYNQPFGDDNSWTTPVTAKYLTGQGKGRYAVLISSPTKSGNIASFRAQTYLISKQDNSASAPTFTKIGDTITKTLGDSSSGSANILDVKSGLRVEHANDSEEYIAVSGIRNMRLNDGQAGWCSSAISFFKLTEDEDGNASFTAENLTIKANHSLPYSPVQMAVGDFTGEGITNQLAVITSNADAIWLTLYTLRKNSNNALEAVKTKEEKVYTYTTPIAAINGFFALPVADVAAGDFDGDGKTELAVVYKNDRTNVPAKGYMPQAIAITGSAVISIYKWSNGAFKTGSVTRDWNYSVSPFTEPDSTKSVSYMKPLAADLDGDGKHELALLTVQWRSRYSRFAWSSTY